MMPAPQAETVRPTPLVMVVAIVPPVLHHLGVAWVWVVLGHLVGVLLVYRLWVRPTTRLCALRTAVICLCVPVLGPIATWLAFRRENRAHTLIDTYQAFTAYQDYEHLPTPWDAVKGLQRELSVQPLVDEVRYGEFGKKQAASESLALSGKPEAIRFLREGLVDPNGEIRLCASLALVKAEAIFATALQAARARTIHTPDEAAGWAALAETAMTYVETTLPTGGAALVCWQDVALAAARALDIDGRGERAAYLWSFLGSARFALGDAPGSLDALAQAVQLAPMAAPVHLR
ncbi:MAG: hypothetical protein H7338_08515, partial [Candidatus Sericytochromatia bacterium]|nr:hypothetical protein [Candidatus Sericytochromatia bacterium]